MKKLLQKLSAMALLCAFMAACCPASAEKNKEFPQYLRISQRFERTELSRNALMDRTYPVTANAQVNAALADVIDSLAEANKGAVPLAGGYKVQKSYIDVGASVSRTGQSWASFLIVARVAHEREQIAVDCATRVYDIQTGDLITLRDVFADDSPAWGLLSREVARQLLAYFPNDAPDTQALTALAAIDSLRDAAFTLGAAWITLTYRADAVYPGKNTLMHVRADYDVFRPLMTPRAFAQTDMSAYRMVALTYDDGPSRGVTLQLARTLRSGCANATFFMVGSRMRQNHDVICAGHDALHCMASHNYEHSWGGGMRGKVQDMKARFADELNALIGHAPRIMRAPGGNEKVFIEEDCGLPLIHWNQSANDSSGIDDPAAKSRALCRAISDGAVVLMHDMTASTAYCTGFMLEELNKRGFLCVTVEELFAANGIALEPNTVYNRVKDGAAQ